MADKRFYIVYEEDAQGNKVKPHIASSAIPGTQLLIESRFEPEIDSSRRDCTAKPTTRYLLRERLGGTDDSPTSEAWGNYVLDPDEEVPGYDTFVEAQAALEALDGVS